MRLAIFSDIHGNLEALQAVLADIDRQDCGIKICLGDIVGYGANPRECIAALRDRNIPCIRGNHDEICATDLNPWYLNRLAAAAATWTQGKLKKEEKIWLRQLPLSKVDAAQGASYVHASLDSPGHWEYIVDAFTASRCLKLQTTPLCFVGHTHEPTCFTLANFAGGDLLDAAAFGAVSLRAGNKYLFNVGSVGQPRDRNCDSAYAFYDTEARTVELKRVPYNIELAQAKIREAGLPESLAARLSLGR